MANSSPPQINVKLDPDRHAVLVAAAYVRDLPSLKELVMPVLDELIDELEQEEAVQMALKARATQQAQEQGVLKRLPKRESRSGGGT